MPLRKKSTRTKFDQKKRYIQNKTNKRKHPQDELPVPKKRKTSTAFGSLNDYYLTKSHLPARNDIGKMEFICLNCSSLMWKHEPHNGSLGINATFSTCCMQGKILLPPLHEPPDILKNFLTDDSPQAKHFRKNIRGFNSSLAFASLGVKEDLLQSHGPYTFRISGSVYHRIGHLFPSEGKSPKFAQIYIYDTENELHNRIQWNKSLDLEVLNALQKMMHNCNPFIDSFKHAAEIIKTDQNAKMIICADTNKDSRRYNLPTTSEISVIIPGNNSMQPSNRDIVLYKHSINDPQHHEIMHINETHPKYDSLHYVLLFPHGEDGWSIGIQKNNRKCDKNVTMMEFYSYRLMQRTGFNLILKSGRLLHQYVVDMYAKIEKERLNFCLLHQHELRAELYQGLADAVSYGDTNGATVGRKIILPSSFTGSPRCMHQLYQDAMSIVRKFGKPDLFITFTCNPNWPEIKSALFNGQSPADRPDLTARVFHQKLKELLNDIVEKEVFGKPLAYVYVIEFQKRGLPHPYNSK